MKQFLYCLLFIQTLAGHAQLKTVDVGKENLPITANLFYSVGGQPFNNYKYVRLTEGTPYFREEWMGGKVIMSGGFAYDSIYLRLDLVDNELHYIGPDGREMIANSPVRAVVLSDSITGARYTFVHSDYIPGAARNSGWYQMLDTGNVTLYKRYVKLMNEDKPYGSAVTEQKISTSGNYFLLVNGQLVSIRKFKDIAGLLPQKKEEIKNYINLQNLSGKNDAEYRSLINYYNSLLAAQ
ncbi:MAG TPA: hypothetical protein PLN49_08605 [Ferruginibacter sp.]|jgi:hypothetical protein|nr:hypothetical protein [Ferruginibacter sp.]MBN8700953.1 hypothetical protein [Chitinophagales bacterium]HMW25568.1 hypothetical protein [Ferruginibacter sp.]HNA00906.1 hypothetical protein [Ferruginibacter sp.]HNF01143.1 hypothetical protein [Ferruginibacter sp.]